MKSLSYFTCLTCCLLCWHHSSLLYFQQFDISIFFSLFVTLVLPLKDATWHKKTSAVELSRAAGEYELKWNGCIKES